MQSPKSSPRSITLKSKSPVRRVRLWLRLTQREMGELLGGVGQSTVCRWERQPESLPGWQRVLVEDLEPRLKLDMELRGKVRSTLKEVGPIAALRQVLGTSSPR